MFLSLPHMSPKDFFPIALKLFPFIPQSPDNKRHAFYIRASILVKVKFKSLSKIAYSEVQAARSRDYKAQRTEYHSISKRYEFSRLQWQP